MSPQSPAPRLTSSDAERLLAERARRQRLAPATRARDARELPALLRALQPVPPRPFTFPGTPPQLAPRVQFDDLPASEDLRRRGAIVKGRFAGGHVAYVWAEDLPLFVAAYRRPAARLSPAARAVLGLLEAEGPTVRSDLKALLEMPGRALSAALIELQQAFLVTELQYETEWDNAWALFDDEFPGVASAGIERVDAVDAVLTLMLDSLAFASDEQLRDRSGFPFSAHGERSRTTVRAAMPRLAASGRAHAATVAGLGDVWLAPSVVSAASTVTPSAASMVTPSAASAVTPAASSIETPSAASVETPAVVSAATPFMVSAATPFMVSKVEPFEAVLHLQDPLVLAERSALARRYGRSGVLAYIIIDGRFAGAAVGRWGIKPFDVEDVRLDPPYDREPKRQAAIVEGLRVLFPPPAQRIRHWLGEPFEAAGEG